MACLPSQFSDLSPMDFKRTYFLSDWYDQEIHEEDVYGRFIMLYILDTGPFQLVLNKLNERIYKKYKIFMPLSLMEKAITKLAAEHKEINFNPESHLVSVTGKPAGAELFFKEFGDKYDDESRILLKDLNAYLNKNSQPEISLPRFTEILSQAKLAIVELPDRKHDTAPEIVAFFDWVFQTYSKTDGEIQILLNKHLFSVILFVYYANFKKNEDVHYLNQTITIDTNILAFFFGINGEVRKIFAHEFFVFAKENGCRLKVSIETIDELQSLVNDDTNIWVKTFKNEHPLLAKQLLANTESAVKTVLGDLRLQFEIDRTQIAENVEKFPIWEELYQSLKQYKGETSQKKVDHDINLICISDGYKRIENIYDHKTPVATTDGKLISWLKDLLKRKFNSDHCPVISLQDYTLLLWIEGKHSSHSGFLSKTWMYVAEAIPYFKVESIKNILAKFREIQMEYQDELPFPISWRSPYILLRDRLHIEKKLRDADPVAIKEAFQSVDSILKEDLKASFEDFKETAIRNNKTKVEKIQKTYESKIQLSGNIINNLQISLSGAQSQIINLEDDAKLGKQFKESPTLTWLKHMENNSILGWLAKFIIRIFFKPNSPE